MKIPPLKFDEFGRCSLCGSKELKHDLLTHSEGKKICIKCFENAFKSPNKEEVIINYQRELIEAHKAHIKDLQDLTAVIVAFNITANKKEAPL